MFEQTVRENVKTALMIINQSLAFVFFQTVLLSLAKVESKEFKRERAKSK